VRLARASTAAGILLVSALGLSACGRASSASSAVIDPQSAVSAAAANPVTVSPLPGTPDASPATQISFLGPSGTRVSQVHVVGSSSGVHGGSLRAYSTGTGESFLPGHPFHAGERVTVHASVVVGNAAHPASTSFTVADQAAVSQKEFPINAGDPGAVEHYASAPALTPSTVTITTVAQPGATPGYLFLAPYQGAGSPGPMITEQDGALVWFHPLPVGEEATNFSVQTYEGRPVLTWWQGRIIELGFGEGEDVIYDSSYRQLAAIRAGNGYRADLHTIRLTGQGTAWIDAFDPIHLNLSSVHGSSGGILTDSVVQEIDVKTGLVMWEWHALGHIPIGESKNPVTAGSYPWDYIHINSADPGTRGNVLLSARNSWTVYDVDVHSGGFIWRLGGSHSSFKPGAGTHFYWQHDAEFQPGGQISLFDNGADPAEERQSRGLLLEPDTSTHTVRLVKALANPTRTLLAESQGNTLSLPGGNWLLGYGRLPNFTEFDGAGHVLLDGTLARNVQNFSTFLSAWSARPSAPPSLAVLMRGAGTVTVAASWNGATEASSWRLLAGPSPSALAPVATMARTGFQTTIAASTRQPYLAVQALDASGAVIGESPARVA